MQPALRSGERQGQQQQELLQQDRVQAESLQIATLEDNVNRALVHLELATEQVRAEQSATHVDLRIADSVANL